MRILGVSVEPGHVVTVKLGFPTNVNVFPLLQHAIAGLLKGVEFDTFAISGAPAPEAAPPSLPAEPVPTTQEPAVPAAVETPSRRRGRAPHQNALEAPQQDAAQEAATPANPPRRRRASAGAEAPAPSTNAAAASPAATQSNSSAPDAATPANPTSRRRARSEPASAPPTQQVDPTKATDLDLSKAASEAAAALSPKAVSDFLQGFGVQWVGQLKPEQRAKFILGLAEKVKAAKAAA